MTTTTPLPTSSKLEDIKNMSVVGIIHSSSHFGQLLLPPLFTIFSKEFHLSFSQLGSLLAIFFVTSSAFQILAGFIVDKIGTIIPLFFANSLYLVITLLAANSHGYWSLALVALLSGLANSAYHPIDFSILNHKIHDSRLGYAFSSHALGGHLGWAIAPILLVTITSFYNWRAAYYVAFLIYLLIFALIWLNKKSLSIKPQPVKLTTSSAATNPKSDAKFNYKLIFGCVAFLFLVGSLNGSANGMFPSLFEKMLNVNILTASSFLTWFMLMGTVGISLGGVLVSHSWKIERLITASMIVTAGLLVLASTKLFSVHGTLFIVALSGFSLGISMPCRDMMVKKSAPKNAIGRVYGLVYCALDLGVGIGPFVFGVLIDKQLYAQILWGMALLCLTGILVGWWINHHLKINASHA